MERLIRSLRLGRRAVQPAVEFLWPTACFGCGEALGLRQYHGACPACWARLTPMRPPICPGCALPRPPATDLLGPWKSVCAVCLVRPRPIESVQAVVEYDDLARSFLLRAKIGGRPELLKPLGERLARAVGLSGLAAGCTAVVPVPSAPWPTLRRGFQPARELARPVARGLGLPLRRHALRRLFAAGLPFKRLGAAGRRARALRAFRARRSIAGERVLLVDDVMTTGATIDGCARALRRAGAAQIVAAVWARSL